VTKPLPHFALVAKHAFKQRVHRFKIDQRFVDIEDQDGVQTSLVSDLDRQSRRLDGAVETATRKGRAGSAMKLADERRKARAGLVARRNRRAKVLAGLHVAKAAVEGQWKVVEADLGPVKYLAALVGVGEQDVPRWFILVVALLLDPAVVLPLLAATARR
jgi:hypothetical protein